MEDKDTQIITLLTAQEELANIAKDFFNFFSIYSKTQPTRRKNHE